MSWYWPFTKDKNEFETYSLSNPTIIEGISDDTILLVIFTTSLIGLLFYYSQRERNTSIHPENREDIATLREQAQQNARENLNGGRQSNTGRPRRDICPICLSDSSVLSVETNCGHLFCGHCIITFWKYQHSWINGMNCPVCRQKVCRLFF